MHVREPFDWDGILAWLAARAIPGVERVEDGAYLRGNVRVTYDAPHVILSRGDDEGSRNATAVAAEILRCAQDDDTARVRRLFDVDFDPAPMHAVLSRDALLAPLLRKRPGVRVPGAWDPFELMVRAIVGQHPVSAGEL